MLKERYTLLRQINLALDTLIMIVAFYLAYGIRRSMQSVGPLSHFDNYAWILLIVIPLWHFLFYLNGLYPTNRLRQLKEVVFKISKSIIVGVGLITLFLFMLKITTMSRVLIILFGLLNITFMIAKEIIIRQI
ncbi:MAG: hypothetical protein KKA19_02075, partial [Candidatus Margulisbacteria bacterium]|nr:hypothetical protein [Candidatus Margulisiibacteriota bacterium]